MVDLETCELLCLDAPKGARIRRALPVASLLEVQARAARALGDPTRLAIAVALREGEVLCVCDVGFIVGRDEKLVSHHLRSLRAAGLAEARREGKMALYGLTDPGRALLDAVTATRIEPVT